MKKRIITLLLCVLTVFSYVSLWGVEVTNNFSVTTSATEFGYGEGTEEAVLPELLEMGSYNTDFQPNHIKFLVRVYDWDDANENGIKTPVSGVELGITRRSADGKYTSQENMFTLVSDENGEAFLDKTVTYGRVVGIGRDCVYINGRAEESNVIFDSWYTTGATIRFDISPIGEKYGLNITKSKLIRNIADGTGHGGLCACKGLGVDCGHTRFKTKYGAEYDDFVFHGGMRTNGATIVYEVYVQKNERTVSFDTSEISNADVFTPQRVAMGECAVNPADGTKPTNKNDTELKFRYWALNGKKYNFNTPVEENILLTPMWGTGDGPQGIIHYEVYLWDHDGHIENGTLTHYTDIPIRGLQFNLESYADNQGNIVSDDKKQRVGNTSSVVTDTEDGTATLILSSEELATLNVGWLIDTSPDGNDYGTYVPIGRINDEDTRFDWDKDTDHSGVKGVRIIPNSDKFDSASSIHTGTNVKHVFLITQDDIDNGFEFTFVCYIVPAVKVTFEPGEGADFSGEREITFLPVNSIPGYDNTYRAQKPADPSKNGYVFAGWYEKSPVTGEVSTSQFDFRRTITQSVILVARYADKTYTVRWHAYNGELLEEDTTYIVGDMPTYDGAPPTRGSDAEYDYEFMGEWYSSDSDEVTVISPSSADITDYYPKFKGIKRTEAFLTITKYGMKDGEYAVFTVKGGSLRDGLRVTVRGNGGSVTLSRLPVGDEYTVEEEGWSYRYNGEGIKSIRITETDKTYSLTFTNTEKINLPRFFGENGLENIFNIMGWL